MILVTCILCILQISHLKCGTGCPMGNTTWYIIITYNWHNHPLPHTTAQSICDMIKRNESLVENFNFYFLTPLYHASFWCKPHYNWISGYRVMKDLSMLINNIKQRNLNTIFANISKTTSPTSDSFLLIMSHIYKLTLIACNIIETCDNLVKVLSINYLYIFLE